MKFPTFGLLGGSTLTAAEARALTLSTPSDTGPTNMRWHPLPDEPLAWIVGGVDDAGIAFHETYAAKDTAICRRDEVIKHGGRAQIGRVMPSVRASNEEGN